MQSLGYFEITSRSVSLRHGLGSLVDLLFDDRISCGVPNDGLIVPGHPREERRGSIVSLAWRIGAILTPH